MLTHTVNSSDSRVENSWLHIGVVGPAAALRRYPGDVLGRVLDVAGLAVHAVLEVDLELRLAVVPLDHLVDPGRAVALGGLGIGRQVVADRKLTVRQAQVAR